ncbi:MAG: hypothetical protein JO295_01505 [Verrucomicrobia bacterium]|nr:hypothetical protein [Verrucomicrobiota bacterium]
MKSFLALRYLTAAALAALLLTAPLGFAQSIGRNAARPTLLARPIKPTHLGPITQAAAPAGDTNPPGGEITGPTFGGTLTFADNATGTGADSEPDAISGVNKNTYVLTVDAGNYAGKRIAVALTWGVAANDRDLYIHVRNSDGTDGALVAESAGGAPQTGEATSFDPTAYGVTALQSVSFNVNTVYFASTPKTDQPMGTIQLTSAPTVRSATYTNGGITFSPNSPCKAPVSNADGEPSSRLDNAGNYYICGIRGVPAGVDLWYYDVRPTIPDPNHAGQTIANPNYDPNMRVPLYRGQPDSPTSTAGQNQLSAGALGGGDIDLAVGFGPYPGDAGSTLPTTPPTTIPAVNAQPDAVLAYASLTAANVTYGRSLDRGQTFQFYDAGNLTAGVPVNDRQWMGFLNDHTVYLEYRNFAQGVAFNQQSTNGGLLYGPAVLVGTLPQTGALDVDRFDGTVYISGNDGHVATGTPAGAGLPPTSYTTVQATPITAVGNIFFPIRVAADHRSYNGSAYTLTANGTVYGVYSDGTNIFLVHSLDKGQHWSSPVQVNDPTNAKLTVNLLPWLATGPTPGTVGIAWYATDGFPNSPANDGGLRWRVFFAQSFNATADMPSFQYTQASDHANHAANISLSGLVLTGQAPNRNLLDYFQINFDPYGAAVIGFTDDHNDFQGHTSVTRQISGPSINAKIPGGPATVPTPAEGSALPAQPFAVPGTPPTVVGGTVTAPAPQPMQPGPNGEQVTDFAWDTDSGLLATAPAASPLDIISILYQSQDSNQGFYITTTMKVSDLSTLPPSTTWRMYFTANAPEVGDGTTAGLAGTAGNYFSKGLSDRGDQFWVDCETDASSAATFHWGTTVRNSDGSLTDTTQGTASRGFINKPNNTLSVRMSVNTLNTYLDSVHNGDASKHISFGSVLCGLRGHSFESQSGGIALEDLTRGGTEFKIGNAF